MEDREIKELEGALEQIWEVARKFGLDPFPTRFEIARASVMYEVGSYRSAIQAFPRQARLCGVQKSWTKPDFSHKSFPISSLRSGGASEIGCLRASSGESHQARAVNTRHF
jgi:hypothetical protein